MSAWIIIHIFLICKRAKLHQKIQVKVLTCRAPTDSDLLTQTYVFILHTGLHKWFKFQSTGATVIKQPPQVFKVAAWRHAQQKFDILDYTYIKANTIFFFRRYQKSFRLQQVLGGNLAQVYLLWQWWQPRRRQLKVLQTNAVSTGRTC